MPNPKSGLDHRAYRRARDRLRRESQTCHICTQKIDVTLPATHPRSWTADHVIPRSKGGALLGELKAAHRDCNASKGNRIQTKQELLPTTEQW